MMHSDYATACCDQVYRNLLRRHVDAICLLISKEGGICGNPGPRRMWRLEGLNNLLLHPSEVLSSLCAAIPRHHAAQARIRSHFETHAAYDTAHELLHFFVTSRPGDALVALLGQCDRGSGVVVGWLQKVARPLGVLEFLNQGGVCLDTLFAAVVRDDTPELSLVADLEPKFTEKAAHENPHLHITIEVGDLLVAALIERRNDGKRKVCTSRIAIACVGSVVSVDERQGRVVSVVERHGRIRSLL